MRDTTPNAFVLSLTLHAAIVAIAFTLMWYASQQVEKVPKIFELVAGPGDDLTATEAAKGSEDGTRLSLKVPDLGPAISIPEPVAQPAPEPAAIPEALPAAKPEPVPVPPTPKAAQPTPAPSTIPNLKRAVNRAETKVIKAEEKKMAAEKAARDRAAKEAALNAKRLTYDEYLKEQGKTGGRSSSARVPRIDSEGLVRGLTNGTGVGAGGKALTAAQQDIFDAYISRLIQALRDAHQKPPGLSDLLQCRVQFSISANGDLANVHIVKSSGNAEFDQSVVDAFKTVGSIGETPDHKGDTWTVTFRIKDE